MRFETGAIPYHTAETLPEACCREIDNCHVLVSIIGGRYGSVVKQPAEMLDGHIGERSVSISRMEVERAVKSGLLLFAFVVDFRIFFKNRSELEALLSAYGFRELNPPELREEIRKERLYFCREKTPAVYRHPEGVLFWCRRRRHFGIDS